MMTRKEDHTTYNNHQHNPGIRNKKANKTGENRKRRNDLDMENSPDHKRLKLNKNKESLQINSYNMCSRINMSEINKGKYQKLDSEENMYTKKDDQNVDQNKGIKN